ncbi:MAG: peptidylprolyl isomerase [bacterium]|nr:peptidylprolyl isomerase [bacterium]
MKNQQNTAFYAGVVVLVIAVVAALALVFLSSNTSNDTEDTGSAAASAPTQPSAASQTVAEVRVEQGDLAGTPREICEALQPVQTPANRRYSQPEQVLETSIDYRAIFCTEVGPVYVDLFEDETPITVNSFVFLSQNGYYNNTTFHRVIAEFMAQGGDPTATGTGGPGYQFQNEIVPSLVFDRPGILAMANAGPNTNGSQFFITTVPTPHLNGSYNIFGEVLEGQNVVDSIRLRDPQTDPAPGTRLDTVLIITDPSAVNADS